jgi:hypothetical protein
MKLDLSNLTHEEERQLVRSFAVLSLQPLLPACVRVQVGHTIEHRLSVEL